MLARVAGYVDEAALVCAVNVRNSNLRRAQLAFGANWAGEWAATVAIGVVAFRHGGAAAVGLVGVARMIPAAIVAPFAGTVADRMRREAILAWVSVLRWLTLSIAAAASFAGGPVAGIYVALVAATVAQTLVRPAHSALLPSLCATPAELASANVGRGFLDSMATLIGPLIAALLLQVSGPGAVFAAAATASAAAAGFASRVRYETAPRLAGVSVLRGLRGVGEGVRVIAADRGLATITALTAVQTFTRGALLVFSVVISIKLLGTGGPGVGVLTAAVGAGAVAGSMSAALLVGRGALARWLGLGVALWGAPLLGIGLLPYLGVAIVMLVVVGVGNALVDVGAFTLPARLADDAVLARVFAAFEGIITLGVAAGALATPALIGALGVRGALVVIGVIAPLGALASWSALRALDCRVRVRDADVDMLRSVPMLRQLPLATVEQLAARLQRSEVSTGASVFEQGDEGDDFYVIEHGHAEVVGDGTTVRMLGPGDGFGEIALLRGGGRTTTVRAVTPLTLRTLSRAAFAAAVVGYSASAGAADRVIAAHLSHFSPGSSGDA